MYALPHALTRIVLATAGLLALLALPGPSHAQPRERCFPETGFCVREPILSYWERNGGLAVFGYPITELRTETVEGNWTGPVQWFERDRLEDHSADGLGVLAGRLGATVLEMQGRPWTTLPQVGGAPAGCRFFPETGHSLCPPFRAYWERNGGLERFGYPLSEPADEAIGDWRGPVQYFERRRMEHHRENAGTPYEVLLGLLGRDVLRARPAGDAAGRIVFTSTRSGNQDIWSVRPDGSGLINLSNNPGADDFQPSAALNRSLIAYVVGTPVTQSQDIWLMAADGSGRRQLTTNPTADWSPALAPDGSRVAFVSDRGGSADIWVMNTDGTGEAVNLTGSAPGAQYAPAWSPDGTRIAYVSDETGMPNIYVMRADGTERYNLSNDPGKRYNNPAWSPDSARIVYEFDYTSRDQDIETINVDGTGKTLVVASYISESNPAWSVDGRSIAFEMEGDIYVADLGGTETRNLTNSPEALDRDVTWAR